MNELLTRGVTAILPTKEGLESRLKEGTLNIYLGIDPTATRIHLGHAVALRKLQQFVDQGHNVTFLIGDFTALIGDTSDKDTERPVLTSEEIEENFKTYKEQASKFLDFEKVTVRHNSEWLKELMFTDIVKLCQHFAVGDFVGRELIKKRLVDGKKVGLHETLYPVMQGYDSYHMDTDLQIGGSDQTFNMLAGRTLQKDLRHKESFVLTVDYLPGTDGRKMSKSWGNAIWLTDEPNEIYGKVMSIPDDLLEVYFTLATSVSLSGIDLSNPLSAKKQLAFEIVKDLHSSSEAETAQNFFEQTFQQKAPTFDDELSVPAGSTILTAVASLVGSNSEAKRLFGTGSIDRNGEKVFDLKQQLNNGDKLQVGKKTFVTIKLLS